MEDELYMKLIKKGFYSFLISSLDNEVFPAPEGDDKTNKIPLLSFLDHYS